MMKYNIDRTKKKLKPFVRCIILLFFYGIILFCHGCTAENNETLEKTQNQSIETEMQEELDENGDDFSFAEEDSFDFQSESATATPTPRPKKEEYILQFQADLDGDGHEEDCKIYYEEGTYGRTIQINDKKINIDDYAMENISYQIVDIDTSDSYKEIAYYNKEYSASIDINEYEETPSFTEFIRWDGENIYTLGAVRGIPVEEEMLEIRIPGDGIVTGFESTWIMTQVFYEWPYRVDEETHTFEATKPKNVALVVPRGCTVIQSFKGYKKMDAKSQRLDIEKGEQLTLDKTDGHKWMHFKTDTGKRGWIIIAPSLSLNMKDDSHFKEIDEHEAFGFAEFRDDGTMDQYQSYNGAGEKGVYSTTYRSPLYYEVVSSFIAYTKPDENSNSYPIQVGEMIKEDGAFFDEMFRTRWVHIIDQHNMTAWIPTVSSEVHQNHNIGGYGAYTDYLVFTDLSDDPKYHQGCG